MGINFLIDILKAFVILAGIGVVFGFICLVALFIIERDKIAENYSGYSTTLGNALLVMHAIFEPGRKPASEQVIWVKKRRTPVEKAVHGLSELDYDRIRIKGCKQAKNLRYQKKFMNLKFRGF
ncbi:MAG: hypothetical protein GX660_00790 [Clostridiaceae bacterium]|nr:hypothetical protein [Clostridiaceae bacterium]